MAEISQTLFAVVVALCAALVVASAGYFCRCWSMSGYRAGRLASRPALPMEDLYRSSAAFDALDFAGFCTTWDGLGDLLGVEPGRLRHSDRFDCELALPKGDAIGDAAQDMGFLLIETCRKNARSIPSRVDTVAEYVLLAGRLKSSVAPGAPA